MHSAAQNSSVGTLGQNPFTIVVKKNGVDLSDLFRFVRDGALPAGKYVRGNIAMIQECSGLTFPHFLATLNNLSCQQHTRLVEKIFGQATPLDLLLR